MWERSFNFFHRHTIVDWKNNKNSTSCAEKSYKILLKLLKLMTLEHLSCTVLLVLCSEHKTRNIKYCRRCLTEVIVVLWIPILFVPDFSPVSSNKLSGYPEPIGVMIYIRRSCRPCYTNTCCYVWLLIFTRRKQ